LPAVVSTEDLAVVVAGTAGVTVEGVEKGKIVEKIVVLKGDGGDGNSIEEKIIEKKIVDLWRVEDGGGCCWWLLLVVVLLLLFQFLLVWIEVDKWWLVIQYKL
jgi:hypothetical protein